MINRSQSIFIGNVGIDSGGQKHGHGMFISQPYRVMNRSVAIVGIQRSKCRRRKSQIVFHIGDGERKPRLVHQSVLPSQMLDRRVRVHVPFDHHRFQRVHPSLGLPFRPRYKGESFLSLGSTNDKFKSQVVVFIGCDADQAFPFNGSVKLSNDTVALVSFALGLFFRWYHGGNDTSVSQQHEFRLLLRDFIIVGCFVQDGASFDQNTGGRFAKIGVHEPLKQSFIVGGIGATRGGGKKGVHNAIVSGVDNECHVVQFLGFRLGGMVSMRKDFFPFQSHLPMFNILGFQHFFVGSGSLVHFVGTTGHVLSK
mmetsp:Transcript_6410/g.18054  ORF Transcript_6410/g.18054 Transcript_6410/m.18054 type:complete len:310 (-) Transcript_6410:622-1551(-)